jgi:hypothetical protein
MRLLGEGASADRDTSLNGQRHTRRHIAKAAAIVLAAILDRAAGARDALAQPAPLSDQRKTMSDAGRCCCCNRRRENERAGLDRGRQSSMFDRPLQEQSKSRVPSSRRCCCDRSREVKRPEADTDPPGEVRDQNTDRENEARYGSETCCCRTWHERERENVAGPGLECRGRSPVHDSKADEDDAAVAAAMKVRRHPWSIRGRSRRFLSDLSVRLRIRASFSGR